METDEPVAGQSGQRREVDVCEMVPDPDGMCSDLTLPEAPANVSTLIARGSFSGSSLDVSKLAGGTFDLVSIEYARANEFSERAAEACDNVLSRQQAAVELRATRRYTSLGAGAYLDEDMRRSGSDERVRARIVRGPSTLTPDTSCETCFASANGGELQARSIETKFTGSATRDRILADGSTTGPINAFVLVEAVSYLPPPLPDQDFSVVDCEAAMHYVRRQ